MRRDYSDIIDRERPVSKKHPPMDRMMRAAQFAPFRGQKITEHGHQAHGIAEGNAGHGGSAVPQRMQDIRRRNAHGPQNQQVDHRGIFDRAGTVDKAHHTVEHRISPDKGQHPPGIAHCGIQNRRVAAEQPQQRAAEHSSHQANQ